jgi:hypothetical protein
VLGAGGDADGLVVHLRGGIVCWLRAQMSAFNAPRPEPEIPQRSGARVDPQRIELVRLMANIMCKHLSEEAA